DTLSLLRVEALLKEVMREGVTRLETSHAEREMRHLGFHLVDKILPHRHVEKRFPERSEQHGVPASKQEPLEIGEQRVRIVLHRFGGDFERDRVLRCKTGGRKTLHGSPKLTSFPDLTCF